MSKRSNNDKCPWKGPLPCEEKDAKRFFGRTQDLRELFQKVRTQELTILTADSGAGKTSLVNAGLIPALRLWRERDPAGMGFALCVRNWGKVTTSSDSSHIVKHHARMMADAIADSIDDLHDATKDETGLLGINQLRIDLEKLRKVKRVEGKLRDTGIGDKKPMHIHRSSARRGTRE